MQTENIEALRNAVETCRGKINAVLENGEAVHLYIMERVTKKDLVRLEDHIQRLTRELSMTNVNVVKNISEADLAKTIASCFHVEEKFCGGAKFRGVEPFIVSEQTIGFSVSYARACLWIDNNVLIALQDNKAIQLYHEDNETLKFKQVKKTTSDPQSMTEVNNSEFAVCFPKDKSIEIMRIVDGCIQTTDKFKTYIDIWDMSFDKTKSEIIGFSRSGKVHIYKLDGALLRSLSLSQGIVDALRNAYSICFDVHTQTLYVSSHGLHKVLAVQIDGTVVFEYSDSKLQYPCYLDLDADGNVWVPFYNYDHRNGVVHQVDTSGTLLREIMLPGNGRCIQFDKKKKRFLVLSTSGELIFQVYDWK